MRERKNLNVCNVLGDLIEELLCDSCFSSGYNFDKQKEFKNK